MPPTRKQARQLHCGIKYLSPEEILPNPMQPRRHFAKDGLEELAESIREHGVLQPLTVRLRAGKYELVAGERRLRASKLAGLDEVPCMIMDVNMEQSSLIALVENLQRRDLDAVEEAEGIYQLIRIFGMSQEEAASKLGKSQSSVANKLRLLRLPEEVLDLIRGGKLTERHGRAVLRLPSAELQCAAAEYIVAKGLNVASAESYVQKLLEGTKEKKPSRQAVFILKDVRVFMNTLSKNLELMQQGGIDARLKKQETDSALVLTISIPKGSAAGDAAVRQAQKRA